MVEISQTVDEHSTFAKRSGEERCTIFCATVAEVARAGFPVRIPHAQLALRALAQLTLLMLACPLLGNSKGKHMGRGGRYAEGDVARKGNGKRMGRVIVSLLL